MPETVYILLGANIGDRERNLESAVDRLQEIEGLELIATSALYVSEAEEMAGENPSFLNQVVKAEYLYRPLELLHALERIEKEFGRISKGKKEARPMDCDILLLGDQVIDEPLLTIPHPRLLNRAFAMIPLLEIDPQVIHPVTQKTVASYLKDSDREKVLLYKDHVARNI
jgi:2-amino-4-hydroxy-6-hydroxymethyldihydropteridine diphosphokinase